MTHEFNLNQPPLEGERKKKAEVKCDRCGNIIREIEVNEETPSVSHGTCSECEQKQSEEVKKLTGGEKIKKIPPKSNFFDEEG